MMTTNIHINDSYKIRDVKTMRKTLLLIKKNHPECEIFKIRTIRSLIYEWRAHNLLYDLHLYRKRTKDVDLNNEPTYVKVLYFLISCFYV